MGLPSLGMIFRQSLFSLYCIPAAEVDAIKKAMTGFSLPTSATPSWAQVVPESVWKAELIGGLQQPPK